MAVLLRLRTERIELGLHQLLAALGQLGHVRLGHALGRDFRHNLDDYPAPPEPLSLVVEKVVLGHNHRLYDRLRIDRHVEGALLERQQRVVVVPRTLGEDGQFKL